MEDTKIVFSNCGHVIGVDFDKKTIVWNIEGESGVRLTADQFAKKIGASVVIETEEDLEGMCTRLAYKKIAG
jgi:hypothetical protein